MAKAKGKKKISEKEYEVNEVVNDLEFLYDLPIKEDLEKKIIKEMTEKGYELVDKGTSCIPGKRNLLFGKK